jgi:hypothetical protein
MKCSEVGRANRRILGTVVSIACSTLMISGCLYPIERILRSTFASGVSFRGISPRYSRVEVRGGPAGPLTVEMEDRTWSEKDFAYNQFVAATKPEPYGEWKDDEGNLKSRMYHGTNYTIWCTYEHKDLLSAEVVISSKTRMKVTIPEGTVELPCTHDELVKALGEPVRHTNEVNHCR